MYNDPEMEAVGMLSGKLRGANIQSLMEKIKVEEENDMMTDKEPLLEREEDPIDEKIMEFLKRLE